MHRVLLLLIAATLPWLARAQSPGAAPCCTVQAIGGRIAVASGNWSAASTWGGARPAAGSRVTIPAGVEVTLDLDPPPLRALFVEGTLRVAPRDTRLTSDWVMVHGLFEAGTEAAPFQKQFTLTLTGKDKAANVVCSGMAMGGKFLTAMNGGRISLHAPSATSWTRLAQDATPGATTLVVDAAEGWQPGDVLVIAPRSAEPGQTERRLVKALSGKTVTLDKPLRFTHSGKATVVDGRTLDLRSEVGRLTRSIVIQGDTASTSLRFGGHVMIMAGGSAQIDGVAFIRMGQLNKLGRYPLHWHLLGEATGQYVKNSAIDSSFQRGIVIHGTQQTLVENNVVFDTAGHNYSVEDSLATDNVLRGNLALENRTLLLTQPTLHEQGDNQAANFWIRAARNTFTGNAAAASRANGFWYDAVGDGPTVFTNNVAHSSYARSVKTDFVRDAGLLVVNVGPERLEFSDSLFYLNHNGVWPAESGAETFRRFILADHWINPAITMDATGANTVFEDFLFVGKSRPWDKGETPEGGVLPPAMLIQYSGAAEVRNPVFAKYGSTNLLSSNDIFVEWQAQFLLSGVRLVETDPISRNLHDGAITTLLDTSYGPAVGTYARSLHPQLSATGAQAVSLGGSGDFLRGPDRLGFAMLRIHVKGGSYFSIPWHQPSHHAVRSDGLRFADEEIDGFRLICGGAYSYALEQAPTAQTFFLSLDNQGFTTPGVEQIVTLSLPLPTAPASVARIDEISPDTVPADPAARLSAAASLAAFQANPKNSYFYDSGTGRLHLQADARWLVIAR